MRAAVVFALFCFAPILARADEPAAKPAIPDRATLEKEFSEKMSGAVLVGRFTVDGKEDQAREERYEIEKTAKLAGEGAGEDDWIITARIKYGKYDVTVPIKLQVMWAGDTPVITLTDLEIPGLGTFTSRVLIYGDRYVGTWQHGKVGGHMFGRLEHAKAEENAEPPKTE